MGIAGTLSLEMSTEAVSKEKHGVWDPKPYVDYDLTLCRLQSLRPTHLPWVTLCQSRLYPPVRDLGLGLSVHTSALAGALLPFLHVTSCPGVTES